MKKLTEILENNKGVLDENSDAELEMLLTEAEKNDKPIVNADQGIVLSRLSDMISMSDDLYDTASSLEEIDKETADAVETVYKSLDDLYVMFDDKYDIYRSDFDFDGMDEDFKLSLDEILNEATDESINEAGKGDWVVVDLNTKKVKYFKKYDGASKHVKKYGGIVASSEYYADNKKMFESLDMEITEATELEEKKVKPPRNNDMYMFYDDFDESKMKYWLWTKKYNVETRWVVIDRDDNRTFYDTPVKGSEKALVAEQKNQIEENKYDELGLSVDHSLNMAQTFWWKLSKGLPKSPKKTFLSMLSKYIQKNKVTYKKMPQPNPSFPEMYTLTFKDKSKFQAWVPIQGSKVKDIQVGNADHLAINGTRGNMFHKIIKAKDLNLELKEAKTKDNGSTEKTKLSQYTKKYKQMYGEKIEGLAKKADETGISYSILKQVFDRGMAAWKTSHRPGTTPHQWAYARVNSFVTGGKTQSTADADLWAKVSGKKESVAEQIITEAISSSALSILKKVGFKEAPVDKTTTKVVNSLSGKKLKLTQLFGISMRAGKWADIFVGTTEDGKYFVVDPSGTTIFNKESELVTALKSAALGESINYFLKSGKNLNDIIK